MPSPRLLKAPRAIGEKAEHPRRGGSGPDQGSLGLAEGAEVNAVWPNELGGQTFRTSDGRFVKYGPISLETTMRGEAERLAWARAWVNVPEVLEQRASATHEWLVTRALDGRSAVDERWVEEPVTAVRAVGQGLRAFHDALPVDACPWEWSVESRIANAVSRGIDVPAALRTLPRSISS